MLNHVDRGSGRPVVLLPGFPLTKEMWSSQIPVLAERCRVIAPDLRGFGESRHIEGAVTMSMYAADVVSLLDDLEIEEPVLLVGFSMGGYVSFSVLREHPARIGALALIDTTAAPDTPEGREGRRTMAGRVTEGGSAVLADAVLGKMLSSRALDTDADLRQRVYEMMAEQRPEAITQALGAMADRPDSRPLLPGITVPTLIVVGEEDQITPREVSRAMAADVPGAELVEIPGAGHLTPMEAPRAVNEALLAFLERTS